MELLYLKNPFNMIKLKSIINEINEFNGIPKMEEHQALDFIKKVVIPKMLISYNLYHLNHGFKPVTPQEIQKSIKKTDEDFPNVEHPRGIAAQSVYDPRITFESKVNNMDFTFTVLKSGQDGHIYITWKHPFNFSGKWIKMEF